MYYREITPSSRNNLILRTAYNITRRKHHKTFQRTERRDTVKKIVVNIGSFNPITNAHVYMMREAMKAVDADMGLFVATNDMYLKNKTAESDSKIYFSGEDRQKMIEAVCKSFKNISFWGFETGKKSPDRYDTLRKIAKQFPDYKVFYVLGADKLHTLSKKEEILRKNLLPFPHIVFDRDDIPADDYIRKHKLLQKYRNCFVLAGNHAEINTISSTKVRELYLKKQDITKYIPKEAYAIMSTAVPVTVDTDNSLTARVEREYNKPGSFGANRGNRLVYQDNIRVFNDWKNGKDPYGFGGRKQFFENSKLYEKEFSVSSYKAKYGTETGVINEDCMVVAKKLAEENYKPAILNLASATHACGGYHQGLNAQEESLCRSSNLSQSLYYYFYPFKNKAKTNKYKHIQEADVPYYGKGYPLDENFGAIYSPDITFFRGTKKTYFKDLEKPFHCSVITCAALDFRDDDVAALCKNENGGFTAYGNNIQRNKIRTILRIAIENGNDSIVLGAFGCGVYKLPPKEIALQFKTVFEEPEFKNKLRLLVFAIMDKKPKEKKYIDFYSNFGTYAPD